MYSAEKHKQCCNFPQRIGQHCRSKHTAMCKDLKGVYTCTPSIKFKKMYTVWCAETVHFVTPSPPGKMDIYQWQWALKFTLKSSFRQLFLFVWRAVFARMGCTGVPCIHVEAVPFVSIGTQQLHRHSCCQFDIRVAACHWPHTVCVHKHILSGW